MKSIFFIIAISTLISSCNQPECDCVNNTVELALEARENGLLFFEYGPNGLCDELLNGLNKEEQFEFSQKALDCPNYYKLDSIKEQMKNDWLVKKDLLLIENPHKTIQRIFDTYNQYNESTDLQSNLDSLKQSLSKLEITPANDETLNLIINVWMYYTVTDFNTRVFTEKVLLSHRKKSLSILKKRMNNKLEWETDEEAPFSELPVLLEKLMDTK